MKKQLSHLKDKLNDISKRNRSIRLLKLYNKWNFDLHELNDIVADGEADRIVDYVFTDKQSISLLKAVAHHKEQMTLSHRLTTLFRNIKSIEEETGLFDLYIGYPFLTGTMTDGTYFQAPLFLYPIRLERSDRGNRHWKLHKAEGDPQLNRSLFLALKKINGLLFSEDMFEEAIEIANEKSMQHWISWLAKYDIKVEGVGDESVTPFQMYNANEVPRQEKGTMELKSFAILGNFPQGNSSLLRDYDDLMEQMEGEQNGLAYELLNVSDWREDGGVLPTGEEEASEQSETTDEDTCYLMQTDGSQEEILKDARSKKGLVVHGPPGTGKSQVIVNLVTDAIHRGKTVLVVCEKRAALDVVYQRLDSLQLSHHVALVHDEQHDRKQLYTKIQQLLSRTGSANAQVEQQLQHASAQLKDRENTLNRIAQGLFEYQPFGYRAYDLYGLAKRSDEIETVLDLHTIIDTINKMNIDEWLAYIYHYGEYAERFDTEHYPLVMRRSFASFEMKDRMTMAEQFTKLIEKADAASAILDELDNDLFIPSYMWLIQHKLEKIADQLDANEITGLQRLRLWFWTSFTGKDIISEVMDGQKFKGISSPDWPKVRELLSLFYELGVTTEAMTKRLDELEPYIQSEEIKRLKKQIAEGNIQASVFHQMHESLLSDFEQLRQMDRIYEEANPQVKQLIDLAKQRIEVTDGKSLPECWVETIKNSVYIHWIDQIEKKHPDIATVSTNQYGRIRDSFRQLIIDHRQLAQQGLSNQLLQKLEQAKLEHPKSLKELNHQVSKKRMIWPLRRLVSHFSDDGLYDLLPVWLTSPEIVSSIFPLEEDLFDLVIFDEASQCSVEHGIPSVYRGKHLVVAGDEKQLPPSNLFRSSLSDDEDEEPEFEIDESQSLLNLAKRRFPVKLLQWHYRSKSEELINFSNHAFYHGQVQIAPNVSPLRKPAAIQWQKVDGQWMNQCNEMEAGEVVALLKHQLVSAPEQTVGIITFNAKQQDKILDLIDQQVEADPEFEAVYHQVMAREMDERIFVKNIENVQGDERDVIIFSIGYAKNEEGRVYNRFGTLNQQGGENRLNVAVSRAKEKIVVVSSIEPHELSVSNAKNQGPRLLKSYLEYAKAVSNVERDQINHVLSDINEQMNVQKRSNALEFDSPFEEQVYAGLRAIGYDVDTQIGMSGYRIDLAVVHPNDPQSYILGIECDGAMYHSSANAKERDVYRQQFLESRGWTITRIWSRNWWYNPTAEIERIDQLIRKMVMDEQRVKKVQGM